MSLKAKQVLESPDLYPLRFDGTNLVFVRMSRPGYRQSIFTSPERIVQRGERSWSVPFWKVMELLESNQRNYSPPAFLFQIAYCGSTLLSRALDRPGVNLVIREPIALRQFALMRRHDTGNGRSSDSRQRVMKTLWQLYSRRYEADEPVLIKASASVNYMLPEILEAVPDTRGILLYSGIEEYLLGILKSEQRSAWAQQLARELVPDIKTVPGFRDVNLYNLTPAQSAAMLWVSQLACYRAALEQNIRAGHAGLRTLDVEAFYSNPVDTLHAAKTHLGFDMEPGDITRVTNGSLFKTHAKDPKKPYSVQQRQDDMARLRGRYKELVDETVFWCEEKGFNVHTAVNGRITNSSLV